MPGTSKRWLALLLVSLCLFEVALGINEHLQDEEEPEYDDSDVMELDTDEFKEALENHPNMMVFWYAPWCGHCKRFHPVYAEAATQIKRDSPEAVLARVDAVEERNLAVVEGIDGFPTMKWYTMGESVFYSGERSVKALSEFVQKQLGPASEVITSHEQIAAFTDQVVVVGYFDEADGPMWKGFEAAARTMNGTKFAITYSPEAMKAAKAKPDDIIVYKKFDGGSEKKYAGDAKAKQIKDFVAIEQLPVVVEFSSQEMNDKIFKSPVKDKVLFFGNIDDKFSRDMVPSLFSVAEEYYGKAITVYVSKDKQAILDWFGVTLEDFPCMYAARNAEKKGKQMTKFEGPLGGDFKKGDPKALMREFYQNLIDDKLDVFRKSQPVPTRPFDEDNVMTLVARTFDKVVYDDKKDVVVFFYAPWCKHCKEMDGPYGEVSRTFRGVDSLVFGKMDAINNEVRDDVHVMGYPHVMMFAAKDKKKFNPYDGQRDPEEIEEWVKKSVSIVPKYKKKKKAKGDDKKDAKEDL